MTALQLDVLQLPAFGTGKASPNAGSPSGSALYGVAPAAPSSFAAFLKHLSGNQDGSGNAVPSFLEVPWDCSEEKPMIDAAGGDNFWFSPLSQAHGLTPCPAGFFETTGIAPKKIVPQQNVVDGHMLLYAGTGNADLQTVAGETHAAETEPVVKTGALSGEAPPQQGKPRSVKVVHEAMPIVAVSSKTVTDERVRQVRIDPADVFGKVPGFRGVETAGERCVSGTLEQAMREDTQMASGIVKGAEESGTVVAGIDDDTRLMGRKALMTGREPEASQKAAMTLSMVEKVRFFQTEARGPTPWTSLDTSEKIFIRSHPPVTDPATAGNFTKGRDNGDSVLSDGNKAGVPNTRIGYMDVHRDSNVSTVKAETSPPVVFQNRDPEGFVQVEKAAWLLANPPETTSLEKSDILTASRLELEPREIRALSDFIEKAIWRQGNGHSQVRIQLKPDFLGNLHVNVVTDQSKVTVEIKTETLPAKDFLERNLHLLKAGLRESGLEIDKIDVLVNPDMGNQQEQRRAFAHEQMPRMNGRLQDVQAPNPEAPKQVLFASAEEGRIDCFV
jgi:hypothetical protein